MLVAVGVIVGRRVWLGLGVSVAVMVAVDVWVAVAVAVGVLVAVSVEVTVTVAVAVGAWVRGPGGGVPGWQLCSLAARAGGSSTA